MQESGDFGKGVPLHAVQDDHYAIFLRQLHHGAVERTIRRLCRQDQIV